MIYVALLRGINVGGKNKINMKELKQLVNQMGFKRVQTYINSGNVIFESDREELEILRELENGIKNTFNLDIKVVLRTSYEFERSLLVCPYIQQVAPDGKNVNIGYMKAKPKQSGIDQINRYKGIDEFIVNGREVHLLFHQSVADSKLARNLKTMEESVTVRNWNTLNKLVNLIKEMATSGEN